MKKPLILVLIVLASLLASAHEFWLQPKKYRYQVGEDVKMDFMVGEAFTGEFWELKINRAEKLELHRLSGVKDLTKEVKLTKGDNLAAKADQEGTYLFTMMSNAAYIEMEANDGGVGPGPEQEEVLDAELPHHQDADDDAPVPHAAREPAAPEPAEHHAQRGHPVHRRDRPQRPRGAPQRPRRPRRTRAAGAGPSPGTVRAAPAARVAWTPAAATSPGRVRAPPPPRRTPSGPGRLAGRSAARRAHSPTPRCRCADRRGSLRPVQGSCMRACPRPFPRASGCSRHPPLTVRRQPASPVQSRGL